MRAGYRARLTLPPQLPAQADPDVMQTLAGEELAALVTHLKLKWQSLNEVGGSMVGGINAH